MKVLREFGFDLYPKTVDGETRHEVAMYDGPPENREVITVGEGADDVAAAANLLSRVIRKKDDIDAVRHAFDYFTTLYRLKNKTDFPGMQREYD